MEMEQMFVVVGKGARAAQKVTKSHQRTRWTHLHFDYTVFATLVPLSLGALQRIRLHSVSV